MLAERMGHLRGSKRKAIFGIEERSHGEGGGRINFSGKLIIYNVLRV